MTDLIHGLVRSSGGGNGSPLEYSCPENSLDKSLAGYSPQGLKELDMTEQLNKNNNPINEDLTLLT